MRLVITLLVWMSAAFSIAPAGAQSALYTATAAGIAGER
jgi:hypothetical protein